MAKPQTRLALFCSMAVAFVLVMTQTGHAASGTINLSANINQVFTLSVSGGPVTLSVPVPTGATSASLTSTVTSNRKNVQWGLQISCMAVVDAAGDTTNCLHDASIPDVVPNANFTHATTAPGNFGGTALDAGGASFSTTITTFYTSPADGRTNPNGLDIPTALTINNTAANLSAGNYTTTITITLTDTGF